MKSAVQGYIANEAFSRGAAISLYAVTSLTPVLLIVNKFWQVVQPVAPAAAVTDRAGGRHGADRERVEIGVGVDACFVGLLP